MSPRIYVLKISFEINTLRNISYLMKNHRKCYTIKKIEHNLLHSN